MMITEEQEFLEYVSSEVSNVIDEICASFDVDRGVYNFHLECTVVDDASECILSRDTLFDDHQRFCTFCGEKTYHFDSQGRPVCTLCLDRCEESE